MYWLAPSTTMASETSRSSWRAVYQTQPHVAGGEPRGVQRGTDATVLPGGGNLADAQEAVFYSPGIAVTKLEVVNPTQVKLTLKVAPDCRLGEHGIRVRTATGVTELRTLWVGALPIVDEKEPTATSPPRKRSR